MTEESDLFQKAEKLAQKIAIRLDRAASVLLKVNSRKSNSKIEREISNISKMIEKFGILVGKEDANFLAMQSVLHIAVEKIKNRRIKRTRNP